MDPPQMLRIFEKNTLIRTKKPIQHLSELAQKKEECSFSAANGKTVPFQKYVRLNQNMKTHHTLQQTVK